jgi:hypothetical protein
MGSQTATRERTAREEQYVLVQSDGAARSGSTIFAHHLMEFTGITNLYHEILLLEVILGKQLKKPNLPQDEVVVIAKV